jgi:hypothetical protein
MPRQRPGVITARPQAGYRLAGILASLLAAAGGGRGGPGTASAGEEAARRRVRAPHLRPQGSGGANAQVRPVVQGEPACKPASVPRGSRVAAIHLGPALPPASCGPPGDSAGPASAGRVAAAGTSPIRPCSGWGLPSRPVTRPLVRSYRTVSPLPSRLRGAAVCSLWHCPAGRPDWPLASTLPCGGRTFLGPGEPGPRPPGRLPLPVKYATRTRPGGSILGAWVRSWPLPSSWSRWPSWRC